MVFLERCKWIQLNNKTNKVGGQKLHENKDIVHCHWYHCTGIMCHVTMTTRFGTSVIGMLFQETLLWVVSETYTVIYAEALFRISTVSTSMFLRMHQTWTCIKQCKILNILIIYNTIKVTQSIHFSATLLIPTVSTRKREACSSCSLKRRCEITLLLLDCTASRKINCTVQNIIN